ncbi:MAG: tetratricopeptide repeat protein [Bacteroidota bacterium]|nr:tetratricopeptide repeat protein [Bacteroidota bacterium]
MKIKYFLLLVIFFSLSFVDHRGVSSFAQNRQIDSLLTLLTTDRSDTSKVNHLITLCERYRNIGDYNKGLKYGNEALQLTNLIATKKYKASAYNNIGNIYYSKGNYSLALKNYTASLKINEVLKNKKDIAGSYLNIGIIYYYQNNYSEALKNYYASLNLREQIGDKEGIANSYTNIGLVYDDPDNYPEALKNYFTALKIYEEIGDKKGIAASYNNIGRIYNSQENYSEALKMYSASLKINEEIGNRYGTAFSYNNLGNIYWNQVNYPELKLTEKSPDKAKPIDPKDLLNSSFKNYLEALKIREETGDKQGTIESFIGMGNVQMDLRKLKEAQDYLNKALILSIDLGSKEWIKESYGLLEELDSIQGNWKAAYHHHKLYVLYRDSVDSELMQSKSIQNLINYNFEKNEAAEAEKKDIIEEENKKKKQLELILGACVIILAIVLARYMYRSRRGRKKNKD